MGAIWRHRGCGAHVGCAPNDEHGDTATWHSGIARAACKRTRASCTHAAHGVRMSTAVLLRALVRSKPGVHNLETR